MAKTLVMPQMGYDMDAGTLLRWLKQEGEQVERGEPIAEIETDKVNLEIESFDSGVVRKHLVTEGQTVPVGEGIAIIGTADEPLDLPATNGANQSPPPLQPQLPPEKLRWRLRSRLPWLNQQRKRPSSIRIRSTRWSSARRASEFAPLRWSGVSRPSTAST